ncbi:MAG TPA: pitrilysin family protein [Longimicrobiaceae bacterium]
MSRKRAALSLLCAAAALAGAPARPAAQTPAQPQSPPPPPPTRVDAPRVAWRERTLPNGLRVFSIQDRATPTVAVQTWYGFGDRDDPPGRNGLSHLIEHLMFQGSRNVGPSEAVFLAEDAGWPNFPGSQSDNSQDAIRVYQAVPSSMLERFLWAEADRLRGLVVNDSVLAVERQSVDEEIRRIILNPPQGSFPYAVQRASYARHPYRNPDRGTVEEVAAITMEDVRAHVAKFFRPDNAVLVVVGDFDPAQLDRLVDRHFGPIPRPAAPLQRAKVEEPARTAPLRVIDYGRVQDPAVAITFQVPGWGSPDIAVLRVVREILGPRLNNAVVGGQRTATRAAASLLEYEEPSTFVLEAFGARGATADTLEKALRAELARMRDEPVQEPGLTRIKNLLATDQLRQMDGNMGKADALGRAVMVARDPARINTTVAQIQAVTADDIRRVLRQYASDERLMTLHYLPQSARPAQGATSSNQSAPGAREGGDR